MDTRETVKTLAVLRAAYPSFYSKQSPDDLQVVVLLWATQFADAEYNMVSAAVNSLISTRTEGWPPTIGEVKAEMYKLAHPNLLTPIEAWNIVRRAIGNSAYHAQEEWDRFPDEIKALITPGAMREMAMDPDYNPAVEGSNFQRSFRVKQERDAEMAMLPESVKNLTIEVANKLALGAR